MAAGEWNGDTTAPREGEPNIPQAYYAPYELVGSYSSSFSFFACSMIFLAMSNGTSAYSPISIV
jgi:hypothetical protein